MPAVISVLSTDWDSWDITSPDDLTTLQVRIAYTAGPIYADPTTTDWNTAQWAASDTADTYTARILLGPDGSLQLPAGTYLVWVAVGDTVIPVGNIGIY